MDGVTRGIKLLWGWPAVVAVIGTLVVYGGVYNLSFNLKAEVTEALVENATVKSTTRSMFQGSHNVPTEVTITVCEAELVFSASNGQQVRFTTTKRYEVIDCTEVVSFV